MRLRLLVVVFATSLALAPLQLVADPRPAAPDADAARAAVSERLKRLQNLIVTYKSRYSISDGPRNVSRSYDHTFAFFDGRARFERHPVEEPGGELRPGEPGVLVMTFRDRIMQQYHHSKGGRTPLGVTRERWKLPVSEIDVALGYRARHEEAWTTAGVLEKAPLELTPEGNLLLRTVDQKGRTHERMFDRKIGFALTSYKVRVPPDNGINIEITCTEFKDVDGLMLPMRITQQIRDPDTGQGGDVLVLQVQGYRVNDPENTPESFEMSWPRGTDVLDTRTGKTRNVGNGGRFEGEHRR